MFPCDARYVVDLGEYDDFYHKNMQPRRVASLAVTVHPLCLWAMTKAQQNALAISDQDNATGGDEKEEDSISISRAEQVGAMARWVSKCFVNGSG